MKKVKSFFKWKSVFFKSCMIVFILGALVACSEDNEDPRDGDGGINPPTLPEEVEMIDQTLAGFVTDSEGNALSGVTITTGTQQMTTGESGAFAFNKIGSVNGRGVFRFSKEGYFDIVRSFANDCENFNVVMYPKGNSTATATANFTASEGKTIEADGMKVDIPASAIVDANGNAYNGTVQVDMIYMDPNNEHFEDMMPGGDLAAVRTDNTNVQLVSYGMVGVNLTDDSGNSLQLKEGKESTVTFPIPEGMDNAPQTIPLWHFNENAGLWVEEGQATRQGNMYVGTVKHFSYWNLDVPSERGTIEGKVVNSDGTPLANIRVKVGQTTVYTDENGEFRTYVPADTKVTVRIDIDYYPTDEKPAEETVTCPGGETIKVHTITIMKLPRIIGKIVNKSGNLSAYARLEYRIPDGSDKEVVRTSSCPDGQLNMYFPAYGIGDATLYIMEIGTEKKLHTHKLQLWNQDIDLGTINVDSDTSQGGDFKISYEDQNGQQQTVTMSCPPLSADAGIYLIDDRFIANAYNMNVDSDDELYITFSGYSEEKSSYTGVNLYLVNGSKGFGGESLTAELSPVEGDQYRIKLSGSGVYFNDEDETGGEAELTSAEIILPITIRGSLKTNITSWSELNMPSFLPQSLELPECAVTISQSKICTKGGALYYKGKNFDDYKKFKTLLSEKSGLELVSSDESDSSSYGDAIFQTGNNYIELSYDSYGIGDIFVDDEEYKISIMVFEGLDIDIDEYATRTRSINAQKHFPFFNKRNLKK